MLAFLLLAFTVSEGDAVLRDFRFASGEKLPELRIHYRTLGKAGAPAVLVLPAATGSRGQLLPRPASRPGARPGAAVRVQPAGRTGGRGTRAMDAPRPDPAWKGGNYQSPPLLGLRGAMEVLFFMTSAALPLQAQAPSRDAADKLEEE